MKVLVAVDGSSYSDAVVESICSRPWPENTEFRVVTVVESIRPTMNMISLPPDLFDSAYKTQVEETKQILSATVARIRDSVGDGATVTGALLEGNPKSQILEDAEEWGADKIILGSHGYGNIARFFLGSVSQAVASHAKCSVEIVRSKHHHEP